LSENYDIAPISKRITSFIIDDFVVGFYFILIFLDEISSINSQELLQAFVENNVWILIIIKIAYHAILIGYNGMTLGKYLTKTKTVMINTGEHPDYFTAFLRSTLRFFDEALLFYFGFMLAFFSSLRQTLHDGLTKTVVINV